MICRAGATEGEFTPNQELKVSQQAEIDALKKRELGNFCCRDVIGSESSESLFSLLVAIKDGVFVGWSRGSKCDGRLCQTV